MKTAPTRGKPQKYPWQRWIPSSLIEGSTRTRTLTLQRGRDFSCQPHGMAQMIRNRISRLGYPIHLSVEVRESGLTITMERK